MKPTIYSERNTDVGISMEADMELAEAIPILEKLADGIDPETGEIFPEDSPYQRVRITRAIYAVLQAQRTANTPKKARTLPGNAGKPWDSKEDEQLIAEFETAVDFVEMAKRHCRTRGAICARLEKLGKLQPRST